MKINKNEMEEMCKHISSRELIASKAQRDSIKYKQAEYLQDKLGQVYDGIVSGVTDWGIYVEIIENKCEGLVRYSTIGKVNIDLERYTVSNEMGIKIRLGDSIKVVVSSVDLEKKQIDFTLF